MAAKRYLVATESLWSNKRSYYAVGTVEELTEYYSYTLECGKCYENEKGNKKIILNPKGINSLISNVNKAMNNSARNGFSARLLTLVREVDDKFSLEEYKKEISAELQR